MNNSKLISRASRNQAEAILEKFDLTNEELVIALAIALDNAFSEGVESVEFTLKLNQAGVTDSMISHIIEQGSQSLTIKTNQE